MCDIRNELTERISSNGYTKDCYISQDEVSAAISLLKFNKNYGGRGLSTNHFKHGSNELAMHTANLFSGLLIHMGWSLIFVHVKLCLHQRRETPI
jgi:hypothetical protein